MCPEVGRIVAFLIAQDVASANAVIAEKDEKIENIAKERDSIALHFKALRRAYLLGAPSLATAIAEIATHEEFLVENEARARRKAFGEVLALALESVRRSRKPGHHNKWFVRELLKVVGEKG